MHICDGFRQIGHFALSFMIASPQVAQTQTCPQGTNACDRGMTSFWQMMQLVSSSEAITGAITGANADATANAANTAATPTPAPALGQLELHQSVLDGLRADGALDALGESEWSLGSLEGSDCASLDRPALPLPVLGGGRLWLSSGVAPAAEADVLEISPPFRPVWKSNLQPDFNVRVCDNFDASFLTVLRELDESNRSV